MKQQEDYVSFELAKKLKAGEFCEPCENYYCFSRDIKHEIHLSTLSCPFNYNSDDWTSPHFSAPTLDQAAKWLRTVHGLHISISAVIGGRWTYEIQDLKPIHDDSGDYYSRIPERDGYPVINTYESALSTGIEVALNAISEWNHTDNNPE